MSWRKLVGWRTGAALAALTVVCVMAYALRDRQSGSRANTYDHSSEFVDGDTTGIEPIVTSEGLTAMGIEPQTIKRIDLEIRSLNASLVRWAAAHRAYHVAHAAPERDYIQARATASHRRRSVRRRHARAARARRARTDS